MIQMTAAPQLTQEVAQRIVLSVTQQQAIKTAQLQLRRDLVGALHGGTFTPKATCPQCGRGLTDLEIMKGFLDDPKDYTTQCPGCKRRFPPRLRRVEDTSTTEVAMFCPAQTLDQLPELAETPVDEFQTKHDGVYQSALLHFGGLKQAFARIGLTYKHEADLNWKKIVNDFLGKMADTVIAELAHVSAKAVGNLRRSLKIPRYLIANDL